MTQTSVEWLANELLHATINPMEWEILLKAAIEMHKKEIIEAYNIGYEDGWDCNNWQPENYYNYTFNTENL